MQQKEVPKPMELTVDTERYEDSIEWAGTDVLIETSVFVRAKTPDGWDSVDIATLDKSSLLSWLRSRGGDNRWAEDLVGILLGHGHLHPTDAGAKK